MKHGIKATICALGLTLTAPVWAGGYTITDLGTMGGTKSYATGINSSGQVVGYYYNPISGFNHGFLWSNGAITDLYSPGYVFGGNNYAYGINATGQVAGEGALRPVEWSNGSVTNLGTGTYANGINDSGQVVGTLYNTGAIRALLWNNGTATDLGDLGGGLAQANAINSGGQVVGEASTAGTASQWHAFLWNNGTMTDLGTLGPYGQSSDAYSINDSVQVVGYSNAGGWDRAFSWTNGTMTELGTLSGVHSRAYSINNGGQIVGYSEIADGIGTHHAVLWGNGTISDLNSLLATGSGWILNDATGINDSGQIVGEGTISGQTHAFLMTPTAVPVPAAAWLFGSGLLGLVGIAHKRKAS